MELIGFTPMKKRKQIKNLNQKEHVFTKEKILFMTLWSNTEKKEDCHPILPTILLWKKLKKKKFRLTHNLQKVMKNYELFDEMVAFTHEMDQKLKEIKEAKKESPSRKDYFQGMEDGLINFIYQFKRTISILAEKYEK